MQSSFHNCSNRLVSQTLPKQITMEHPSAYTQYLYIRSVIARWIRNHRNNLAPAFCNRNASMQTNHHHYPAWVRRPFFGPCLIVKQQWICAYLHTMQLLWFSFSLITLDSFLDKFIVAHFSMWKRISDGISPRVASIHIVSKLNNRVALVIWLHNAEHFGF